jgi:methionyl aminopeptidase
MNKNIQDAFEKTRRAGSIAAGALDEVCKIIKPGLSTNKIDKVCFEYINDNGAYSAPLFYRGFPKSCCTSPNHTVCHGIPSEKILKEGDIVNVDVTAIKEGWPGDTSRMFLKAIKILNSNIFLGDIGNAIQEHVESNGFSVVRDFCGHGIGEFFHKEPNVLHYGRKGTGQKLREGMIFTIEPMINAGKFETKVLGDGWTAVTKDKSLSAQFEHTVGITSDGYEIFTQSKNELNFPPYNI